MFAWVRAAVGILVVGLTGAVFGDGYGIGTIATPAQIAGWDIDVRPDGKGLPPGQGSAGQGDVVYQERCASCHGEFGEARGRYPALMGGIGTLNSEDPVKTVGSYWPYASTVFDYVRRAMPFGHAQSLSNDEAYAITAYILNFSEIVEYKQVMNATTLPSVKMPNRDGFIEDNRPDVPGGEPCMSNCRGAVKVIGKARVIDVTPQTETTSESTASPSASSAVSMDSASGKKVFAQCSACHSLVADEHRVGPSLHGIVGRQSGAAAGFERYSAAMKRAAIVWDEAALAKYLKSPQNFVPETNMPFAGIASEQDIRNLIDYLRAAGN